MKKEAFAHLVDDSLYALRAQLLGAFPDDSAHATFEEAHGAQAAHGAHALPKGFGVPKPSGKRPSAGQVSTGAAIESKPKEQGDTRSFNDSSGSGTASQHLEHAKTVDSEWSQIGGIGVSRKESHPLKDSLEHLGDEEARAIRHRLRLRLGALTSKKLVTGKSLHDACSSLGLTRYTIEDMNELVNLLADFIDLTFEASETKMPTGRRVSESSTSMFGFRLSDVNSLGKPVWQWPHMGASGRESFHRSASLNAYVDMAPRCHLNVVPAQPLMDLFLAQEGDVHRKCFGPRILKQFQAMKEILLAGDTNRLVAELTFVRINDLAAPPEPMNLLLCLEPLVAVVIIANGVMIGFQTHPYWESWPYWIIVESAFAIFLVMEIALRMYLQGRRSFFRGAELQWNLFDVFLGLTGVTDVIIQLASDNNNESFFGTSLLRFCRLIRLVRIVKVFRLKAMKDLRLMVKGLIAGVKTLVMAFTLLFTVLYVISGFATMTLGQSIGLDDQPQIVKDLLPFFKTIPASMFTAFRCFTGECTDHDGRTIHSILAEEFGPVFIFSYVASYMLVSLGIFNVILAVYVDITMKAAKENDAVTLEQHSKESIRIARITRELLKKFAGAYRMFQEMEDGSGEKYLDISNRKSDMVFTDGDVHEGIAITKELFLIVIQDRRVQDLMDELELPPDRANLFEIIDADGSGTLHVAELVHGLLKIRGEINKSDVVAGLLASKACYDKVAELKEEQEESLSAVRSQLAVLHSELLMRRRNSGSTCLSAPEADLMMQAMQVQEEEERDQPPPLPDPPFSKPLMSPAPSGVPLKPQLINDDGEDPPAPGV